MLNANCEICGSANAQEVIEATIFEYAASNEHCIELSVDAPVISCPDCDLKYTDDRAERLRYDAVCMKVFNRRKAKTAKGMRYLADK